MIKGLGVDIVRISRFKRAYERSRGRILKRIFREEELKSISKASFIQSLAARFCGKEAVLKAFGLESPLSLGLRNVLIVGKVPEVILLGELARMARDMKVRGVKLSISHDSEYAVAVALLL